MYWIVTGYPCRCGCPEKEDGVMRLIVTEDYARLSETAAEIFAAEVLLKPESVLGLATGSTPVGMYKALARKAAEEGIDFSRVTTFNLDEYRGLSGDHPQSYRYFMEQNLFGPLALPRERTHIPDGMAADPGEEAARYEAAVEASGGVDIQLLGIGGNGHIGFNEPDNHFPVRTHLTPLTESTVRANARFFDSMDEVPREAITMGIGTILKSRRILLLASGEGKAEILWRSFYGPVTPQVPASILQFHPDVWVIADCAAAEVIAEREGLPHH